MKNKTLIITIRSNDVDADAVKSIKKQLEGCLPDHNVAIIGVSADAEVDVHEFVTSPSYKEER